MTIVDCRSFAAAKAYERRARIVRVEDFGAKGSSFVDDSAAFIAALNSSDDIDVVLRRGQTYRVDQNVEWSGQRVRLRGEGALLDFTNMAAASALSQRIGLRATGSIGNAIAVTDDVAVGDRQITIADTTSLMPGMLAVLTSDENYVDGASGTYGNRGMIYRIESVDDATHITFEERIHFEHAAANSATIQIITPLIRPLVEGVRIVMGGRDHAHNGIYFNACVDPLARENDITDAEDMAIRFDFCYGGGTERNRLRNATSPSNGSVLTDKFTGYGVGIYEGSRNILIKDDQVENCRHSTGGSTSANGVLAAFCTIRGMQAIGGQYGGTLDCHEECMWWSFENNTVTGIGAGHGIGISNRGLFTRIVNNLVRNAYAQGIRDESFDDNSDGKQGTVISGNIVEQTGGIGIDVQGTVDCISRGGLIANNIVRRSTENNIAFRYAEEWMCCGNHLSEILSYTGSNGHNIRVFGTCAKIIVEPNIMLGAPVSPILIESGSTDVHRSPVSLLDDDTPFDTDIVVDAWAGDEGITNPGDTVEHLIRSSRELPSNWGLYGFLRIDCVWSHSGNAGSVTPRMRIGAVGAGLSGTFFWGAAIANTNTSSRSSAVLQNANSESSKIGGNSSIAQFGSTSTTLQTPSVDTSSAREIAFSAQLANGADSLRLRSYRITLVRYAPEAA